MSISYDLKVTQFPSRHFLAHKGLRMILEVLEVNVGVLMSDPTVSSTDYNVYSEKPERCRQSFYVHGKRKTKKKQCSYTLLLLELATMDSLYSSHQSKCPDQRGGLILMSSCHNRKLTLRLGEVGGVDFIISACL